MDYFLTIIFIVCLHLARAQINPYEEGPYQANYTEVRITNHPELDHHLGICAPNATGNFPVFYFSTGFADVMPPIAYYEVVMRIASHGIVVIAPHKIQLPFPDYTPGWLDEIDTWSQNYLTDELIAQGFDAGLHIDFENPFFAGHSSGAHVVCNHIANACHSGRAKGLILMSPVDGPPANCLVRGEKVGFELPTLIMPSGLDDVSAWDQFPNWKCAPANYSNQIFFDAMTGPIWMVNATEYGHGDFLNDAFYWALTLFNFCGYNDNEPVYMNYIAGQIVSFMKGILGEDCSLFEYLENEAMTSVDTRINLQAGDLPDYCGQGYCIIK